jgi:DNA-directed RNA polymerase subunit beta'
MNPIFDIFPDQQQDNSTFGALRVSLANPDLIRTSVQEGGWSWGEIRKPETINYRTFKPEHDGLFCAKIFGPTKDYECLCGKYKRTKHRRKTCERCKVEVISSKVRRERLGHIDLAAPVAHIWFLKSLPSRIGNLLDMTLKDVEEVLYCLKFIITHTEEQRLQQFHEILSLDELDKIFNFEGVASEVFRPIIPEVGLTLTEEEYNNLYEQYRYITNEYYIYLDGHIEVFQRAIELAREELKTLGGGQDVQKLRYLIENQNKGSTQKVRVDHKLRHTIHDWIEGLRTHDVSDRYREKISVISWTGDRDTDGQLSLFGFEPVAGDDLKSLPQKSGEANKHFVEAEALLHLHLQHKHEIVTDLDLAALTDDKPSRKTAKSAILPLSIKDQGGRVQGISLYIQINKDLSTLPLPELTALFKQSLTYVYGDLRRHLSSRVESALHTKTTIKVNQEVSNEISAFVSNLALKDESQRSRVGSLMLKLMPHNFISVLVRRQITDDNGTRDLFVTAAGDEVSSSEMEQERIRSLVVEAEHAGTPRDQAIRSLVIPINPNKDSEEDGEDYYLYLQSLFINPKDVSYIREIFTYALDQLTRSSIVSYNAGRVRFDQLHSFEVTKPHPAMYEYVETQTLPKVTVSARGFNATGKFVVSDEGGTAFVENHDGVVEEHRLKFGDTLRAFEGQELDYNQVIADWEWPPFQTPVLSKSEGIVIFRGMGEEDQTLDGIGKGARVSSVESSKNKAVRPAIEVREANFTAIKDGEGYKVTAGRKVLETIDLPKGATLNYNEGEIVGRGQALAFVESTLYKTGNLVERKVADQLSLKLSDQLTRAPYFKVLNDRVVKTNTAFRDRFGFDAEEGQGIDLGKFLGKDAGQNVKGQLGDSTGGVNRRISLVEDWGKGAQYLRSTQHVTLLGLSAPDETTYFVLKSQDLSDDLTGVIERVAEVVNRMSAESKAIESSKVKMSDSEVLNQLLGGFDQELIDRVDRLFDQTYSETGWQDQIKMLHTAARFNQYLQSLPDSELDNSLFFTAEMGANAIRKRLRTLDMYSLHRTLKDRIPSEALRVMSQAFEHAYFFEKVDRDGFEVLGVDLPEGMSLPSEGETWSEEDYQALCRALKTYDIPAEHRPLFHVLPVKPKEDAYLLQNISAKLISVKPLKSLKLSLGQEMTQEEFEIVSKQAFIGGQTDIYVVKQISPRLSQRKDIEVGQEITYQQYVELHKISLVEGGVFDAQVAFEAEEMEKGAERFQKVLSDLSIAGLERLSRSIRHSSKVSSDLQLRKSSDQLISMVRWLDTLDKLKAFEVKSNDTQGKTEQDCLDDLRCAYFEKTDPRVLTTSQCQSREWFLLTVISEFLRLEMINASDSRKKKYIKRLKVVDAIRNSQFEPERISQESGKRRDWFGNKPEWMILEAIPVIPPDLRPLVPLDGGRFATSDLNDLYRRVIYRNNRLRRLTEELQAPDIIQRNEKRMLQEAVDALFDNGRRGKPITGPNKRPFKSLSAMIKGKQGRFRQNLLGKRVDYSGRSVIVVGPELRLQQCGLPKKMALELFKPFILSKLQLQGYASTIKAAKKMIEDQNERVWDILAEVIQEHPVMLNRAPTLHRLGIQAFEPKLIEGKAIQLHPLVCTAFNADFDGDQMAVHLPLSIEAQIEARVLMMSSNNILLPASGKPIIVPSQDIVLGCYYMTRERYFAKGEGRVFASPNEALIALESGAVHLQAKVRCRIDAEIIETTVGRLLMAERVLPRTESGVDADVKPARYQLDFSLVNRPMGKKQLAALIDAAYRTCTAKQTVLIADAIKDLGYAQATLAGISIAVVDLNISDKKRELVESGYAEVAGFQEQARDGMISKKERYNKVIDKWTQITEKVAKSMLEAIQEEEFVSESGEKKVGQSFNSVHIMADSGARGGPAQIRQLAGMRGLMAKPSGEIIETPITANFREGLSVLEYFISAHGARKGLADTALKTANSGYLTRRLVDVAQDAIITEYDCQVSSDRIRHLLNPIEMRAIVDGSEVIEKLSDRVLGRVVADEVYDELTGEGLIPNNTLIGEAEAELIDKHAVNSVAIRSPLTCETRRGVCVLCYGRDLGRGRIVNLGEAVGVIAAQSIGEPGTQLTMRTFHIGGAASQQARKNNITSGTENGTIKLVNEHLITPTTPPEFSISGGHARISWSGRGAPKFIQQSHKVVLNRNARLIINDASGVEKENHPLGEGYNLIVKNGDTVKKKERLVYWDPFSKPIFSEVEGVVVFENISLEEGTLKEERETSGAVVRRIGAPIRSNKARAIKGRKSTKNTVKQVAKSPRIKICKPVYNEVDGEWIVTAGEVITFTPFDSGGGRDGIETNREALYDLPVGAKLEVENGGLIGAGQPIAKTDVEAAKTRDITGGLPRVAELFEARAKEKSAVLAQIEGRVEKIEGDTAKRYVTIQSRDAQEESVRHLIKGQSLVVREGDMVSPGDPLSDGPISPHEILRVKNERAVAEYLVHEIQQVYRLQGVRINDKHIEVIVRQMLRRVRIKEVGDTQFLPDEQVEKWILDEENARAEEDGKKPAIAEPLLLGITKAALATESFISASSFQETTKVLTAAALKGKIDYLHGLKENVIMGRLIPAGTGLRGYQTLTPELVLPEADEDSLLETAQD